MKQILILSCLLLLFSCKSEKRTDNHKRENTIQKEEPNMENLKVQLEAKKQQYADNWSSETLALHENGIDVVEKTGITGSAFQVGQMAPDFTLNNALGKAISLNEVLKQGPVVLTWYRGGWCPYCNLTLRALQQALPEIKAQGATLLTLTPEVPDKSLSTAEKNELEFEVLSDVNNKVGKSYGVVFKLEENVAQSYQNGFNLHAYNGDDSDELPMAATYIIGTNGIIKWAFLDADYRNRAEPSNIVNELKKL